MSAIPPPAPRPATEPKPEPPRARPGRPAGPSADDLRVMLRAASLYHLDGLTQAEIATRLGVSRPTAGRLVSRARAQGLVRIEISVPAHLEQELHTREERALEERFGLAEVIVVGEGVDDAGPLDDPASFVGLGRAAASLLARRLEPSDTLGFTWGPETVAVAEGFGSVSATCGTVVQLDGSVTTSRYQTGAEYVLGSCADRLRATPLRLAAPLYADPGTVTSLRSDSVVSRALDAGSRADMMMFGVGAVSTSTTLFEGSFLDTGVLDEVSALGAVGEMGGRFYRRDGSVVGGELAERTVSVPLPDVRGCRGTVLVSGGAAKHEAVLGALNGGLATMLVVDLACARWLLSRPTEHVHTESGNRP